MATIIQPMGAQTALKTTSIFVPADFDPSVYFWPDKNSGLVVEGAVMGIRNHRLVVGDKTIARYVAIQVKVKEIRKRAFDDKGNALDTSVAKEELVRKGYLNKYDRKKVEDPYALTIPQTLSAFGCGSMALPSSFFVDDAHRQALHPNTSGVLEFWGERDLVQTHHRKGDIVRLATRGGKWLIESLTGKSDGTGTGQSASYAGEDVLGGWTSKINVGGDDDSSEEEKDDDDDWD